MCPDPGCEHALPAPERLLPERGVEEGHFGLIEALLVTAPGVVDQQVQASLLAPHRLEETLDILLAGVVAADRDPDAASLLERLRRLLERSLAAGGRWRIADAATSDIHGRAGFTQHERDRSPGAAARTGHHRHHPTQVQFKRGHRDMYARSQGLL